MEVVTRLKSAVWCHSVEPFNQNSQLVKSINGFLRTFQTILPNEKILSKRARPKEFLRVSERFSRETRYRNRSYESYTRRSNYLSQ